MDDAGRRALGPKFCHCGDPECWHWSPSYYGYLYCRPDGEHHRPPECPIDEQGQAVHWWETDSPTDSSESLESPLTHQQIRGTR